MSKNLKITIFLSSILLGLLLIPLDGRVDNTFVFFVGRFHPILLHLPIGGLIALFVMEMINSYRPKLKLDSACRILLWFSIITIIPTATRIPPHHPSQREERRGVMSLVG